MLEKLFQLKENQTTLKTEFLAGFTTFMTMVYIIVVNPQVLADAGMDQGAVFYSHCNCDCCFHPYHGLPGEFANCTSSRDGFKCLFCLYYCTWDGLYLADGFGCCFSGRNYFYSDNTLELARENNRWYPEQFKKSDFSRYRPIHCLHWAKEQWDSRAKYRKTTRFGGYEWRCDSTLLKKHHPIEKAPPY